MYTIKSIISNNNSPTSKINVMKLTYVPPFINKGNYFKESCTIYTKKGRFFAYGTMAETCITHLVKGQSICCTYKMRDDNKMKIVQINGCNASSLPEHDEGFI
jgi:hypothetical protein